MKRYVLYSEEWGVFLGEAMGMGWWSKLDPIDQPAAVTFASPDEAKPLLEKSDPPIPDGYRFVEVTPSDGHYATISDIVKAGLPGWEIEA